ncbi:ABC transporter permease [Sulfitobacter geojensis]|jgi:peptide/nickel transport system permease protein|uniref:ABC transporter permease n=1 Tax=Sulfitobacter geojensis TaxID=1342299 RepID=A0AAE2VV20_9RHOB|nr:ABC transporter permease [Sulfitobacter geojensis]KHA52778.1 Binding-protein-dependent transport systems inner membrane component [Sulfitobacter geojensis]MBM1687885.1 ABC transporter permease [Sulfitobacter geojensis]MBM1691952.1 ABC transporter permease [Sulfitobacter geojensis]MBM1704118.1 ABC transporter permease [Sulfitobacter geojensis]MBM1708176.1 ABC transporter permease [Sulfitobacter geojensis]
MTEQAIPASPIEADIETFGALTDKEPQKPPRSQWKDIWDQFRKHKGAVFGGGFLIFITLGVIFGPWLWDLDPKTLDIRNKNWRPVYTLLWDSDAKAGWAHPFGTDQLGRDILSQMIAGGRVSMAVGWLAMALALIIGTAIGVLSGYFKRLDFWLMRFTDLALSLPILPLTLLAVTLFRQPLNSSFGPEGGMFILIVGIIGLTSWMQTARIVRGDILALKEREFILAARSIGTTSGKIIRRHLLPNVISPIMVSATLGLATAIITESALSFLGVGFPSDFPTWGKLLADAVQRMQDYPERVLLPGIAISLTVLSVNYLGDGLRDALDPRIRGR